METKIKTLQKQLLGRFLREPLTRSSLDKFFLARDTVRDTCDGSGSTTHSPLATVPDQAQTLNGERGLEHGRGIPSSHADGRVRDGQRGTTALGD